MYERHYGLSEKPFEIAPDPKFLFLNSNYRELLASLIYGVTERKGLIALVGEVGTGKTLMLNALKERLDASVKVATIVNPDLTFRQMLNMILADLDLYRGSKTISVENGLQRLQHFAKEQFESSGNVVVIVDEAQNLRSKTMESMRMLSNIETASAKLIQLIFSGQPELDQKLKKPEWRQLVQRISIKRRSTQLTYAECREYIRHRMAVAGGNGSALFSDNAQKAIFKWSEGIPRKINILCDNALLIGYGLRRDAIGREIVEEAVSDLDWASPPPTGAVEAASIEPIALSAAARPKRPVSTSASLERDRVRLSPIWIVLTIFALLVFLTLLGWEMAHMSR
jgi:general secretion pathway protein A